MSSTTLNAFLQTLANYESPNGVFNPWSDYDEQYDVGPEAPRLRVDNLRKFLEPRLDCTRHILMAEAAGYQGAKFSGIAMTSERILLGEHAKVSGEMVPDGLHRTSLPRPDLPTPVQKRGFTEPTATIVWGLLQDLSVDFSKVVLWNIFPFHPFDQGSGRLTNRAPTAPEVEQGKAFYENLRRLLPQAQVICLGRKSADALNNEYPQVRHPAQGGANDFRRQLPKLLGA